MKTRYFGPDQFRKDHEIQVTAPVGQKCLWCDEEIQPLDVGTIDHADQILHYECSMRMILGSVGHIRKRCSCYGGTEEDPAGMTRRQAAKESVREWERGAAKAVFGGSFDDTQIQVGRMRVRKGEEK